MVTDRGGGGILDVGVEDCVEGVDPAEEGTNRACGVCIDALDGGGGGELVVGEEGPGNGDECNRMVEVKPGFALRNLSTSACNCAHS